MSFHPLHPRPRIISRTARLAAHATLLAIMALPVQARTDSGTKAAAAVKAAQAAKASTPARGSGKSRPPSAVRPGTPYGDREDVLQWADELAQRQGWPQDWTRRTLSQARQVPRVAQLIMPAPVATAKNWAAYRARFVEPRRIEAGLAFWREHAATLERAQARWGVPAELIVGIIGVETYYGRHMGGFHVLDALATLSFDFPSGRSDRSAFFRDELTSLLVLARQEGRAPADIKGSYAGAIGWPQFMPGSILRHAVDFDGDGHVDLERSVSDAIGSVAQFLVNHGWRPGMPTHYPVTPPSDEQALATLLAPDIRPTFSAQALQELGAELDPVAQAHEGPLALVELHNGGDAPTRVVGTENFYAVTRYNWSSYYALAVIELGRTVRERREAQGVSQPASPAPIRATAKAKAPGKAAMSR